MNEEVIDSTEVGTLRDKWKQCAYCQPRTGFAVLQGDISVLSGLFFCSTVSFPVSTKLLQ